MSTSASGHVYALMSDLRNDEITGVDTRYQRGVVDSQVRRLTAAWDDSLRGVIAVNIRRDSDGGGVYLIDGLQRFTAANRAGVSGPDYTWDAIAYEGLTLEEEAEMFRAYNRTRAVVGPYYNYNAECTMGDPRALAVQSCLASHGLVADVKYGEGRISCVSTLLRIVKPSDIENGVADLSAALTVYEWAFPVDPTWRADVVEAIAIVMRHVRERGVIVTKNKSAKPGEFSLRRFASVLASVVPAGSDGPTVWSAAGRAESRVVNNRPVGRIAFLMLETYNRGLVTNLVPSLKAGRAA